MTEDRIASFFAKSNRNIMAILEKYLLSFQFTKKYLDKFQKEGDLTKEDLLAFYNGEEVKDQFKTLDIDGMLAQGTRLG